MAVGRTCRIYTVSPRRGIASMATVRAMKMNGGVGKADLGAENVDAVKAGCPNLGRHVENLKSFGVPVVVAINRFVTDTDAEVQAIKDYVAEHGAEAVLSRHWELGSEGSVDLARIAPPTIPSGARDWTGWRRRIEEYGYL